MADLLPTAGTALDVAGGLGADARWLAGRGLATTLLDVSDVALSAAQQCDPDLAYVCRDVEAYGLPTGAQWDVITMHRFLDRDVIRSAPAHLAPGGLVLLCHPTERNLERHERPSRRLLLGTDEVHELAAALVVDGLTIVEASEAWRDGGGHDAWLVARA